MIFFSLFKTLEGKVVLLELKNSLQIRGTLASVDQYLNLKLDNVEVVDRDSFPQLVRRMAAAQPPRSPPRPPIFFPWEGPRGTARAQPPLSLSHRRPPPPSLLLPLPPPPPSNHSFP